jgi:cbb3-type cytochrome oxidase subunit 3
MKFLERKKSSTDNASAVNLRVDDDEKTQEGEDDDSFARRSSRTIDFLDDDEVVNASPNEKKTKEPPTTYSVHTRTMDFLDAVPFEEQPDYPAVEETKSSGFSSHRRTIDSAFLNDTRKEEDSLMAIGPATFALHEGLAPLEEADLLAGGAPMEHDGLIMGATRTSRKRNRCSRSFLVPTIAVVFILIVTIGSVAIANNKKRGYNNNNNNNNNLRVDQKHAASSEKEIIDTPSPNFPFWEDELSCIDNLEYFYTGQKRFNCTWVQHADTRNRCMKDGVMEHCRATCDPSCSSFRSIPTEYAATEYPTELPTDSLTSFLSFDDGEVPNEVPNEVPDEEPDEDPDEVSVPTGFPTEPPTFIPSEK